MRRTIARGRILPQSLSTDPRYGRLSLKAQVLYPLLWINCDDQGRLSGDPDEVKYATCPSVSEIAAEEIPALLEQMEVKGMIRVYTTSRTRAVQMLDWWRSNGYNGPGRPDMSHRLAGKTGCASSLPLKR